MIVPVILSGGSGSRLWPVSREKEPKQLLPLTGTRTMLQDTVARLQGLPHLSAPLIVCNDAHRFLVAEQLHAMGLDDAVVVVEPCARGTAPAAAAAALLATEFPGDEDPVLLVMPADHVIRDEAAFRSAATIAARAARADNRGALVTFGIVPDTPETGFGYIRSGAEHEGVRRVEEFVEKPNRENAERYLASGQYLWNSGIFLFGAARYLEELARFSPASVEACRGAVEAASRESGVLALGPAFHEAPSDSIDYAVMEKTDAAVVVPLEAGWSDVGSWAALREVGNPDDAGNVTVGDVLSHDCEGSYLHASTRLVAGVGLRDHIVVETADAVLVAPRSRSQDVKQIVETLRDQDRDEASLHRRVRRPWGSYDGVDAAPGFQVKRLMVHPGSILSLQKHHRRAEHWVVVQGEAHVTLDDEIVVLEKRESIDIEVGQVHRVENRGSETLIIIEVQTGEYLGEDDIVRLEDKYGREGTRS